MEQTKSIYRRQTDWSNIIRQFLSECNGIFFTMYNEAAKVIIKHNYNNRNLGNEE